MPAAGGERAGRFEGYADAEATSRKVLRNVFKQGDSWYRTGDLMRRDERGFYYFVDRVGDTYRWKGENVSTAEVLTALTASRGVVDGVVYGVAVPGADGRAGTAALLVNADFDLEIFRAEVAQRLPPYARPVFLRILSTLEATGTFKPRKQDLVQAGFDPGRIPDPLYFDDARIAALRASGCGTVRGHLKRQSQSLGPKAGRRISGGRGLVDLRNGIRDGHLHDKHGAARGRASDIQAAAQRTHPVTHRSQSMRGNRRKLRRGNADTVIGNSHQQCFIIHIEADVHGFGARMFENVAESLLGDSKQRDRCL